MYVLKDFYALFTLPVGLLLLWWTGSRAVHYSVKTAKLFGLSQFFVGFVVMAVSTGIPELSVVFSSLWYGVSQLSVADIIGSNLHDISIVLGLPAVLIGTIHVRSKREQRELFASMIMSFLTMSLIFSFSTLHRIHGFFLIALYGIYLVWLKKHDHPMPGIEVAEVPKNNNNNNKGLYVQEKVLILAKLCASLLLVALVARFCVQSALALTRQFVIEIETLGIIFFAMTTSLPELVMSLQAVRKKKYSLAVGNALGSVFEQATLILGLLALFSPIPLHIQPVISIAPFMIGSFAVLSFSLLYHEKIGFFEGICLLIVYGAFIVSRMLGCMP